MADSNNFADINENFDTIKTMLNSIRAQGVLNTSDVDRLLEGINSKLEKINTEEDIDLIKAFLSELKKNLDERHEVLVSKFGAIESLFSNLLKNSTDSVKTAEMKEYFDIVATNLSVFSREVVSQKETLTDITLRLDAMRSDDTQKKDIIKSISTVRNDIEKVNNGFDSIVISLNENFKTVLKTISEVDQSEAIKGFSDKIADIIDSSNTILSAIQLLDKKNDQFENSFDGLATQDDTSALQRSLIELNAKSQEIENLVEVLTEKSYRIDSLAEKIDASVNIIAGLKAEIADKDDGAAAAVIDKLADLEEVVKAAASNSEFEDFKKSLQAVLSDISKDSAGLKQSVETALKNINGLNNDLKALDINANFQNISQGIEKTGEGIKEKIVAENDKISKLMDVNVTRTLNDISSSAEVLNTRLKESHALISELCEKSFEEVTEGITGLKEVVAQLDENNVSANNAIFSNITDRLAIFENSLKTSLEKQEDFVSGSSENVFEQISNVKNIIDGIEYKLDSNAIEFGNAKKEYAELKKSIDDVLALDFINVVKDVKAELYASKQDIQSALETVQTEVSEGITSDLFGKYELLVSKLDSVEDQIKIAQAEAMNSMQSVLKNISASIVDVLSYVSTMKEAGNAEFEEKLSETVRFIQDSNLNYIDNVRDIVDVVREQIEENLKNMNEDSEGRLGKITASVTEAHKSVKLDLKSSYEKLIEIQGNIGSIKELMTDNGNNITANVAEIVESTDSLKEDFESKMSSLRQSLSDMVSSFKADFTCENQDNISELKFNAENLYTKYVEQSVDLKNALKAEIAGIIESLKLNIIGLTEMVSSTSLEIESANKEVVDYVKKDLTIELNNSVESIKNNTSDVLSEIDNKVVDVVNGFDTLESSVNNLTKETTSALTGTLAKILDNFVALNAALENFDAKSAERMKTGIVELQSDFDVLKRKVSEMDSQVDEDLAHQISIIEGNFESLNLMMVDIMNQATDSLSDRIKRELSGASAQMSLSLSEELEQYKVQIADLFEGLQGKNDEQAAFIKECTLELDKVLNETLTQQGKDAALQLEDIGNRLKEMIHDNVEVTAADYDDLKLKLNEFIERVERQNNVLVDTVRAQLDDVAKFVDSNFDIQAQEVNSAFEEISSGVQKVVSTVRDFNNEWSPKLGEVQTTINEENEKLDLKAEEILTKIQTISDEELKPGFASLNEKLKSFLDESMLNFVTQYTNSNSKLSDSMSAKMSDLKEDLTLLNERMENDEVLRNDARQDLKEDIKADIKLLNERLDKDEVLRDDARQNLKEDLYSKFNDIAAALESKTMQEISKISDLLKVSSIERNEKLADVTAELKEYTETGLATLIDTVKSTNGVINALSSELAESVNLQIQSILDLLKADNEEKSVFFGQTINDKVLILSEQIEKVKQNSNLCKELILKLVQEHSDIISRDIEKETDVIIKDLTEQFDMIRTAHKDDMSVLTETIEGAISGYIIDSVNDLKSYMDVKTDNSVIDGKLDSLRTELSKSIDDTAENINKLLQASVFADALSDLRATNEILLGTMSDKISTQIQDFVRENVSKKIDEKIGLLDKKFIDTVVDKYEEVKLYAEQHNKNFEKIAGAISGLISDFSTSTEQINTNLKTLIGGIHRSVDELKAGFADLKAQIMNKSFDEAFHASVHNQVSGIENLVKEQLQYIEDINDLCGDNLPELMEMNMFLKHSIAESINELKDRIAKQEGFISDSFDSLKGDISAPEARISGELGEISSRIDRISDGMGNFSREMSQLSGGINNISGGMDNIKNVISSSEDNITNGLNSIKTDISASENNITYELNSVKTDISASKDNITNELNSLKTDIITQFLDIYNQISFITEQEEITDFIQEKHSELITILSHIVTTIDGVEEIKENVTLVDNKLDVLKDDIDLINEKLTSIMSSDGDIDYVYSLQDLESDIANLRLALNEMKNDNKSKEFEELIQSTNNIYEIVSAIKSDLPKFETEEFKRDFNNLAEDIVSISTRTNKLILTSDESYKTLQDNLQDFKLVINDLDERTRNFAHESGIDKLDYKLASINKMIQSGAQTNQVFNQIFEYLAEWVDRAGEQLAVISDKVDTLDDIGQIRVMLEDLKAESEDNANAEDLVNALEQIFDKQAKRISSLEAKLDKIIVASNVNSKKSKTDIKPIEDALNKFLSVIEGKFVSQQDKISSLETKLEEVVSLVDNKDTAQLTKKVGGMDKQLAKLNKSIEKIASNVVEK